MTSIPLWLVNVLDRELSYLNGGERDRVALAVMAAIPAGPIAQAIAFAARDFLCTRNVQDHGGDLSRAIAKLAAPNVIAALRDE